MKININDKELMARLFVERMKEKSEKEIRIKYADDLELKKDAEIDCLYYWLLSRLYVVADSRIPARPHGTITVKGPIKLQGKEVITTDLRAGAALIVAALSAEGETTIKEVKHVLRGYAGLIKKITQVGGEISLEEV